MPEPAGHHAGDELSLAARPSPYNEAASADAPSARTTEPQEEAPGASSTSFAPAPAAPRGVARLLSDRAWPATSLVVDALMLVLAVTAALVGAERAGVTPSGEAIVWIYPPLVIALLALRHMYASKITVRILDEAAHVVGACSVAAMTIVALASFIHGAAEHAELAARLWVFGITYVGGSRLVLGLSQRWARDQHVVGRRTLIVGAGKIGAQVERRLTEQPDLGLRPVGYVDAFPPPGDQVPGRAAPVLGSPDELERIVKESEAEHVVLAFLSSRGSDAALVPIVRQCHELGLEVSLVPRLFERINIRAGLEHIGGMPLFRLHMVRPKGWQFAVKHVLDRLMASGLILILAPLLIGATIAVKLSSPGPVFFRQRRIGRDGHVFDLLKFRSMRLPTEPATDKVSVLLPEDTAPGGVEGVDRRTPVGSFLRRASIDELPQLFNVLKGDMSIVGPRPERPEFVELFGQRVNRYDDRHRVKSGITGWAQVHGLRGKTSLSDRIEWDNFYIENWSLWLDFKILLMTIAAVLRAAE